MPISDATRAQADLLRRQRRERARLESRYDFWGGPCECGLPLGECTIHERARPSQRPPDHDGWDVLLAEAGRGWGKTRLGAEYVRLMVEKGRWGQIALINETVKDVRDVQIEGESGLLAISPPWFRPIYEPSKARVTWPNGAIATIYSAEQPGLLRGPQFHGGWCDELSKWRHAQAETWDMLQFGLRLGEHPQVVVTNTPLPSKKYKEIRSHPRTYRIGGSTFENRAHLAPSFFDRVTGQYQGTRLGRQELEAELFEDTPGALWSTALLESTRCKDAIPRGVDIVRTVIGVDPAGRIQDMTRLVLGVSAKTREPGKGDEAGIVVACLGDDGHAYVLADCSTLGSPHAWGAAVADAYLRYAADRVVGEANHGGVTVEEVIRTVAKHRGVPNIAYKPVWASKGKHTRAEPVAALYEQNRVHHIGCHSELEAEMCDWLPGGSSPNRMDALVFTLTELMLQGGSGGSVEVGVPRERDAPLFAS